MYSFRILLVLEVVEFLNPCDLMEQKIAPHLREEGS
jgi:hypothetical protein